MSFGTSLADGFTRKARHSQARLSSLDEPVLVRVSSKRPGTDAGPPCLTQQISRRSFGEIGCSWFESSPSPRPTAALVGPEGRWTSEGRASASRQELVTHTMCVGLLAAGPPVDA